MWYQQIWNDMYDELIEYKNANGDCNVPKTYPTNRQLAIWVRNQRQRRKNFDEGDKSLKMTPERIAKLNEIGFVWNKREASWLEMYGDLVKYNAAKGDCNVPQVYALNPKLGRWVFSQREAYHKKKKAMTPKRIAKLDKIGFEWDRSHVKLFQRNLRNDEDWNARYKDLIEYKRRNGNCNVPKRYPANPKLGRWVGNQRTKRSKLTPAQVQKLEDIGFVWDASSMRSNKANDEKWNARYKDLIEYREKHGDCNVPTQYPDNPALGRWVNTQRTNRAKMKPERVQKLEDMGFVWKLK